MNKLGIFGGSFDPVHNGHLILAEQCREQMELDRIWFVPAARPPHKPGATLASMDDRLTLLRLAVAGRPEFEVHDLESTRDGASFTVDTLRHVQTLTDDDLVFLMGADSLGDLPTWRDPDGIASLATIAAANRGFGEPVIPDELSQAVRDRIQIVPMPACGISASDIRQRRSKGRSIRYLVPRPVELAITDRHLYDG